MLYDGVKKEPYHCFQIFFLNKGFKLQKILFGMPHTIVYQQGEITEKSEFFSILNQCD